MRGSKDRRFLESTDRRRVPRGGRRAGDRPGRFPILLVADGYEGARRPFVRYLERFGFRVEEAATAPEASAILDRVSPHVLLTDLTLSDASALFQRSSTDPLAAKIPTIGLLSWEGGTGAPDLAHVLIKPFRLRAMLEAVRQVLRAV